LHASCFDVSARLSGSSAAARAARNSGARPELRRRAATPLQEKRVMPSLVTVLKYGALAFAGLLWTFGLIDQLDSIDMTARYLAVSAAMVAVAAA
jgi:hypothetical protein